MRNHNEENLSTKQVEESPNTRVSCAHGDKKRKKNFEQKTRSRTQTTRFLTDKACFPKTLRLLKRREFLNLKRHSKRFYGDCVSIDYAFQRVRYPRLGITVSKKFGKAHARNYFKRCVRESFRNVRAQLPQDLVIQVCPLSRIGINHTDISPELIKNDFYKLTKQLKEATGDAL